MILKKINTDLLFLDRDLPKLSELRLSAGSHNRADDSLWLTEEAVLLRLCVELSAVGSLEDSPPGGVEVSPVVILGFVTRRLLILRLLQACSSPIEVQNYLYPLSLDPLHMVSCYNNFILLLFLLIHMYCSYCVYYENGMFIFCQCYGES